MCTSSNGFLAFRFSSLQTSYSQVKQSHYRPGQAQTVPGGWGSKIWRQSAHEGGKVVSLMHRPSLPHRKYSWHLFLLEAESPQGHSATESIMSKKNFSDTIGNRTHDLPACNAVPQPTAPPLSISKLRVISVVPKLWTVGTTIYFAESLAPPVSM